MKNINTLIATIFLFLASAAAVTAQDPVPTPPPIVDPNPETVFTEEIKVNVAAFDRFGATIDKVTKKDLVIVEDGRLHQAESVRRLNADVLIVLDTGGKMRRAKSISQTRDVAKSLVKRLSKGTKISTLEYHDKARVLTEWTTDKEKLLGDLDKKLYFGIRSIFSDALELATAVVKGSRNENRHLVLISDGTDTIWSDKRRARLMRELLKTNINVHVISYTKMELVEIEPSTKATRKGNGKTTLPPEVIATLPAANRRVASTPNSVSVTTDKKFLKAMGDRKSQLQQGESFLESLSTDTGGLFLLPDTKDEMIEKAQLVARAIDSNFVITYVPKRPLGEAKPGETRIIQVTSRRPGLFVEARRKLIVGDAVAAEL